LVLNKLWQAVNVIAAQRSISLLYARNCRVVVEENNTFSLYTWPEWLDYGVKDGKPSISGLQFAIQVPRVILLNSFSGLPHKEVEYSRHNIFERDDYTCQYCGLKMSKRNVGTHNLDHVTPRHQGGKTAWDNIVLSCVECNTKKANRNPEQAGMKLLKVPKKPRWRPFAGSKLRSVDPEIRKEWASHMDIHEWRVEVTGH
jgi:5-methylcytosine-specific restriction endonuclease McrA